MVNKYKKQSIIDLPQLNKKQNNCNYKLLELILGCHIARSIINPV